MKSFMTVDKFGLAAVTVQKNARAIVYVSHRYKRALL